MIAIDSSTLRRFFEDQVGRDPVAAAEALAKREAVLPPPVLSEIFSSELPRHHAEVARAIPLMRTLDGFWQRAGELRRSVLARGRKANLADCLIAQFCIDHRIPLITHDHDFRNFVAAGLKLA